MPKGLGLGETVPGPPGYGVKGLRGGRKASASGRLSRGLLIAGLQGLRGAERPYLAQGERTSTVGLWVYWLMGLCGYGNKGIWGYGVMGLSSGTNS